MNSRQWAPIRYESGVAAVCGCRVYANADAVHVRLCELHREQSRVSHLLAGALTWDLERVRAAMNQRG